VDAKARGPYLHKSATTGRALSLIDPWHRFLIRHLYCLAFQPGVWLSPITLYAAFLEGCWLGAGGEDEGTSRTWIAFVDHFGPSIVVA